VPDAKNVLVVEDEESLLKLESILLATKGYRVTGVTDGLSAIDALTENPLDLVLLDLMIPEVDGFEVCRRIKGNAKTRHIPVVIVTAKKNQADRERGIKAGADLYITKPFRSAELVKEIERLLE